ncbi:MAG: M23 family metallopeptidase [Bacillaceae bacterium]|nr:M23 family metallopeptidase [Bacillaceae bacterium]
MTQPNHEEAVPVAVVQEEFQMPVTNQDEVQVVGYFFDVNAPREQQLAALVQYDNNWFESKGIDLALESGESFEVVAALSGTVIKSEKDALVGNTVRIEHENNLVTVYQSLEGVVVKEGQSIKQGEMVGKAGRNLYNQDAGVHVHFQVHQDQVPVNPMNFIDAQAEARNAEEQEQFNNQLAQ